MTSPVAEPNLNDISEKQPLARRLVRRRPGRYRTAQLMVAVRPTFHNPACC